MLDGYVDDARFYRRALNADDVAAVYLLGQSPVANDDVYGAIADSTLSVDALSGLLSNDLLADEIIPTISVLSGPLHGTLQVNADGSFNYHPEPGFFGLDRFSYRLEDGRPATANADVTIQVMGTDVWNLVAGRVIDSALGRSIDRSAASISSWQAKTSSDGSFSDLIYTPGTNELAASLMSHTWRLHNMAAAFQDPSSEYFQSNTLRTQITLGWSFLANYAPSSLGLPNWYAQKIGIPNSVWPGLALFQNELSEATKQAVLDKYFTVAGVWEPNDLTERSGGMNLSYRSLATIAEAVLRHNPARIPEALAALEQDLHYQGRQATGLRPDDSFHQHTSYFVGNIYQGGVQPYQSVQWYSGTYGIGYAQHIAAIANWLHGTVYSMDVDVEHSIVDFILDGQRWLFRNQGIEPTSTGRSITLNAVTNETEEVINPALDTLDAVTNLLVLGYRTEELAAFAESLQPGSVSTSLVTGNKSFWTSDVMIQQQASFMASVRMISQRTLRPETLQRPDRPRSEGAKSYFLADGVTTVYRDGQEYSSETGGAIFPAWNWTRLPGTTLEQISDSDLVALSYSTARDFKASSATGTFVGSVSNGLTGLAAMDYGRTNSRVTAKKSWFFFQDGFIALGADIDGALASNSVNTTLVQAKAAGDALYKDSQGSLLNLSANMSQRLNSPQWLLQDQVGYVPIGTQDPLVIERQNRTGDWTDIGISQGTVSADVFTAWFDHGAAPNSKSYAYAVLPGVTSTDLDNFVRSSPIVILSNTAALQAVQDARTATTQMAFHQAGSLTLRPGLTLSVSHPCLVQLKVLNNNNVEISISDPTQSLTKIDVSLTQRLYDSDVTWDSVNQVSRWTIDLPDGTDHVLRGQSVVRTFHGIPDVTFSLSQSVLPEKGGSALIYAQLSAPSTQNVSVELAFQGTATLGADYLKSSVVPLVIPAGQTTASTWISIVDDALYEPTEVIRIEALRIANAFESTHQVLEASIIDDEPVPAAVTLGWSSPSISEAGGTSFLTAALAQPSLWPVTVELALGGTATLNEDYTRSALTRIVIPAGQLSASLWLAARNDTLLESNETVTASVTRVTNGFIMGPSLSQLVIVDDEITVTFSLSQSVLPEKGGSALIYAQLSAPSTQNVSVELAFQGTATLGADYLKSSVVPLVIPAGQTTASTWISIVDDALYEPTEVIRIEALRIANAFESTHQVLEASIIDDEPVPAAVTLGWSSPSISEAGGTSFLTAALAQPSLWPVTVELALGGTATLNEDYTRSALTRIVIPAGQLSASLWLAARNDTLLESNETVTASVTRVTNGFIMGPSLSQLVIVDDEITVTFSLSQSVLPEKGGSALIYAQLSAPSTQNVSVELAFQGTATLGADYLKSSVVPLVIPAGQTTASTWISIVDDALYEPTEVIRIEALRIANAFESTHQVLEASIIDDEPVPAAVTLGWSSPSISEAGGTSFLTAALAQPSLWPVTVELALVAQQRSTKTTLVAH